MKQHCFLCNLWTQKSLISIFASVCSLLCCSKVDWWLVFFMWVCSSIYQSNYCLNWWFFLLRWWTLVSSSILICMSAKNFDFRFLTCDAIICEVWYIICFDRSLLSIAWISALVKITVIFTYELVKCSKATSVSDKIIIMKAKLQAISDAIAICSEKALKNSEIWVYMNSQMTLQRLNVKSNVNVKLFDDIRQNLINLHQNQCQICIQWISSRKSIIGNEKAD